MDFDLLLESVYPHKQFTEFVKTEKPHLLPYLTIIRKVKQLQAKQQDLKLYEDRSPSNHNSVNIQDLLRSKSKSVIKLEQEVADLQQLIYDIAFESKHLFLTETN